MISKAGVYNDAVITDCGFGESGNGTPFIFTVFDVEGEQITGYFYLTEKSAKYTQEKLLTMGIPKDTPWEEVCAGIEDGDFLKGFVVQIIVDVETFEGKDRPKVNGVRSNHYIGGPQRSESGAENAKKFGALWRQTGKTTKVAAPVVPTADAEDSDVPF
jgi:hypothetical protein